MGRGAAAALASEAAGTMGLVAAATGSAAADGASGGALGPWFVAGAHFAGLFALVLAFGRYSMAHFNPAVTAGFVAAGRMPARMAPPYVAAQLAGAFAGSLLVHAAFGGHAALGVTAPGPGHSAWAALGAEALATALLMGVILAAVGSGARAAGVAAAVGGIVALDVLAFGPVSGASMNPARSLAPAAAAGIAGDLWIYWTATFAGSAAAAAAWRAAGRALRGRRRPPGGPAAGA